MTARATALVRPAPGRAAPRRPTPALRPVRNEPTPSRWRRIRSRLRPAALAGALVAASLVAVVVGNMQLAAGQLRLQQLQSELVAVQSAYATTQQQVAVLESPAAVAAAAERHHLVDVSEILQLPGVSLLRRLPPPTFSYAPCCTLTPGR